MVYLRLPTLPPKRARPYRLHNDVCASCYHKPKLNARWLNSIHCSSAFNHSCCCSVAHRYIGWQTANPPHPANSSYTAHMHHFPHDKWDLPLARYFFLCLPDCNVFVLVSLTEIALIITWGSSLSNESKSLINHHFNTRPNFHKKALLPKGISFYTTFLGERKVIFHRRTGFAAWCTM